jgi:TolB-like protein
MWNFWREMRRRHVVRIAGIYFAAGWLLIEIMSSVLPVFEAPLWVAKTFTVVIILAFPIALILAWAFEITPDGIKLASELDLVQPQTQSLPAALPDYLILLALVLVLVVGLLDLGPRREVAEPTPKLQTNTQGVIPSVAILPFIDLGEAAGNQYLGNGIAEEILNALAKWEGLQIASRTSSFAVQNKDMDIQEIGERLGVAQVLEGSLRRQEGRIKVTAQLSNVETGFSMWSEAYDREFEDIFDIQESLARSIVVALQGPLAINESQQIVARETSNIEAYNLMLKGRYYFQSPTQENFALALEALQKTVELDPEYWTAHGYLAFSIGYASIYINYANQVVASAISTELALRHDPLNVPANLIKGFMGDSMEEAYVHYMRALNEDGDRDLALYVYTNDYLAPQLRQEESKALLTKGLEEDPASLLMQFSLAMIESRAGRYPEALEIISTSDKQDGSNFLVSAVLCDVYYRSGDAVRLQEVAEQSVNTIGVQNGFISLYLLQGYLLNGDRERAVALLDKMLAIRKAGGLMSATVVGMSLASLGRIDEAVIWFVRAQRERDFWLRWHLKSAILDVPSLGENQAIQTLLEDMELDDASIAKRVAAGQ